tara:strand:+ start:252 stop:545 length:294 start_codon:yes stop_codon:yes gene_type:complete
MADNNSKKPMALLLLVVVGVLIVLALSEDENTKIVSCIKEYPAYCSDVSLTTKEQCDASKEATWTEALTESINYNNETSCIEAGGTWDKHEMHDHTH